MKLVGKFAAGGVYTGGKFASGVVCSKIHEDIRSSRFTTGVIDNCSAQTVTRIGLLEEIPRSGVQIPCLY